MSGRISSALALLALCGSALWGQGYVIRGNQITVEGRHLQRWDAPAGTVEFLSLIHI